MGKKGRLIDRSGSWFGAECDKRGRNPITGFATKLTALCTDHAGSFITLVCCFTFLFYPIHECCVPWPIESIVEYVDQTARGELASPTHRTDSSTHNRNNPNNFDTKKAKRVKMRKGTKEMVDINNETIYR